VQVAQPLAIGHITFSAGDILEVPGVCEHDLEAARFEDLGHRDPIDAGRFDRHARHATRGQPVGQPDQIIRERRERLDRVRVAIARNRDVVLGGSAINAGDIRIEALEQRRRHAWFAQGTMSFEFHQRLLHTAQEHPGTGRRRSMQSPKRDQVRVTAPVTNDVAATPRATLKDGLVQHQWGVGLGSRMPRRFYGRHRSGSRTHPPRVSGPM
jgi:hypothetical protein